MSWIRTFSIALCFEVLVAAPLAYWLMWQFAFKADAVSNVGRSVLIPAVLILPLVIAAIAFRRRIKTNA